VAQGAGGAENRVAPGRETLPGAGPLLRRRSLPGRAKRARPPDGGGARGSHRIQQSARALALVIGEAWPPCTGRCRKGAARAAAPSLAVFVQTNPGTARGRCLGQETGRLLTGDAAKRWEAPCALRSGTPRGDHPPAEKAGALASGEAGKGGETAETGQKLPEGPRDDQEAGDVERVKSALAPRARRAAACLRGHGGLRGRAPPRRPGGTEARGTGFARLLIQSRGGAPRPVPRP
jgi:hypothetical protein